MATYNKAYGQSTRPEGGYDGSVYSARQTLKDLNPSYDYNQWTVGLDQNFMDKDGENVVVLPKGKRPTVGEKISSAVGQLNVFKNSNDQQQLDAARKAQHQVDIPDSVLVDGLPYEFALKVMEEKSANGSTAAAIFREQLKEDIKNGNIQDNLEWYEQLGYGAVAVLTDPSTYMAGGVGLKAGKVASTATRKAGAMLGQTMPREADLLLRYGAAGLTESAVTNAPRLSGDHTYTVADYQADLVVDTLLGTGLTYAGAKAFNKYNSYTSQNEKRRKAAQASIDQMQRDLEGKGDIDFTPPKQQHDDVSPLDEEVASRQADDAMNRDTATHKASWSASVDDAFNTGAYAQSNDGAWMAAYAKEKMSTMDNPPSAYEVSSTDAADLLRKLGGRKKYYHGTKADFATFQPSSQSGGLLFFTDDPNIASKYATGESAGYHGMATEEARANYSIVREDRPDLFGEYGLREDISVDDLRDVLFRADTGKADELLEALDTGADTKRIIKQYNELEQELDTGANVKVVELDIKKPYNSPKNPIPWREAEKMGIDNLREQGYDAIYVEEQGGVAVAVLDAKQVTNFFDRSRSDSISRDLSDAPLEVRAAVAKIDSERAQLEIEAIRNRTPANPYRNISYGEYQAISLDSYPVKGRPTRKAVQVNGNVPFIVDRERGRMADHAMSDSVSNAEIVDTIATMKAMQKETESEGGINSLDLSTGELEAAADSAEKVLNNPKVAEEVGVKLLRESLAKTTTMVADYHGSGEHNIYAGLLSPRNIREFAAKAITQWGGVTQDLATKFISSKSPTLNWVGTHLTEMGRGYGGDVMRKHTAGLIRDSEYMRSISQIMPSYDKAVKEYAASKGSSAVGQMMAATSVNGRNPLQDEFSRKFMNYMNRKRIGRSLPDEPIIAKFVDEWEKYMKHNYKTMQGNRIKGFDGTNERSHYVPQVWQLNNAKRLIRQDEAKVKRLLESAIENPHPNEDTAQNLIDYLKKEQPENYDGYLVSNDARSLARLNIDWEAELDGLKVLDLLETDLRKLSTNYSNRVAGWAGLSKASGGKLTSYSDLEALKLQVFEETQDIGDVTTLTDTLDMLFGRQVQGGLPDYARSIKAATVLTRLGGLGAAQLIETGTVATRAVMESMSDPKFMKKLTQGMNAKETAQDLMEIQKLTGNDWDYHLINAESDYYTDKDVAGQNGVANATDYVVNKMTGGDVGKQVAGRAFGHVTGYNLVRKYQSAMVQRSFAMQVARYFATGQSKMSVQRMADYGLTNLAGKNNALKNAIQKHVRFDADGYPTKYNFDKWSPQARDSFMYALQRAEAQELMRPLVGEMPEWFNKPWMQMLMQFRTMPIVAQNKALGRSLAFADKEAVVQLMLNSMTAGLVRYGKFAGLAALAVGVGEEWEAEYERQLDRAGRDALLGGAADRYVTQLGAWSDAYALTAIAGAAETPDQYVTKTMNQIPAYGLVKDYVMAAYATSQGDGDAALKHVQGIIPLGNTLALEAAGSVIEESIRGE